MPKRPCLLPTRQANPLVRVSAHFMRARGATHGRSSGRSGRAPHVRDRRGNRSSRQAIPPARRLEVGTCSTGRRRLTGVGSEIVVLRSFAADDDLVPPRDGRSKVLRIACKQAVGMRVVKVFSGAMG